MDVVISCQNLDMAQEQIANVLGIQFHQVHCRARRLGGGFGGNSAARENRRVSLGRGGTAQNIEEGLPLRDSVTRVRKEGGEAFYKHCVGESDSESTGYASISFSDSDTGSDDQGGETNTLVIGEEEEQKGVVMLDLEKEVEGVNKEGGDIRQGGGAGSAPGSLPLTGSVSKPLAGSVTKPQGHVGFSSLPDQVSLLARMVIHTALPWW